jgi:predicted AAA+ superfamily ATPase
MIYQRPQLQLFTERVKEPRRFIQVLFGPRQVGKTTMVNQILTTLDIPYHFAAADLVTNGTVWIEQQWETARMLLLQSRSKEVILAIDEVQKIENWSEAVKLLWDEDTRTNKSIKVILLGSSRLLLQQGLTESLAGRFETTYLGHWSYQEMQSAFNFTPDQYVWFGGYPGAASLIHDDERWRRYVLDSLIETSISRDILLLTRVDKPALMRRLFELGCAASGQIMSYTKVMGQLQDAGNTVTLAHYLQLLNTAGLLTGLEKFAGKKHRQRSSSPKFQVYNTALMSAQQGSSFDETKSNPVLWGRWIESAIGAHLLNQSLTHSFQIYYWRERNDEVDFIIERGEKVIAIEVKTNPQKQTKGMEAFAKQWKPYKVLMVGQQGFSWQEFLKLPVENLFQ